jgi:hypothetical protein
MSTITELYDQDYCNWALQNAELLRQGRLDEIDLEHMVEELEELMGNTRRELYRRLRVLLAHLLKWQHQSPERSGGWAGTIRTQRQDIAKLFKDNPSLKRYLPGELGDAYSDAVELAAAETGKPIEAFPAACPYTTEQVLSRDFWPD